MPRHAQEGLPPLPTGGLFVGAETDKVGESPTAAVVALPPGADDDVLTVVEGAPVWAAPSPPSGGSGLVGTKASVGGDPVSSVTGDSTPLPWVLTGDPLLDLTDPLHPAVVDGGVYALGVGAYLNGVAIPGKFMTITLEADTEGADAEAISICPLGIDFATVTAALTFPVPAGGQLRCSVRHDVGVDTLFVIFGVMAYLGPD